jgi:hypothetical protein
VSTKALAKTFLASGQTFPASGRRRPVSGMKFIIHRQLTPAHAGRSPGIARPLTRLSRDLLEKTSQAVRGMGNKRPIATEQN